MKAIAAKHILTALGATTCVLVAALSGSARAAQFCVTTGNQLQTALNTAASNDQDDVIKVVRGTLTSNMNAPQDYQWRYFFVSGDADNALVISGGWSSGDNCQVPNTLDPSQTVLDAQHIGGVLNVQPHTNSGGIDLLGDISISNLTFTRGTSYGGHVGASAGVRIYVPNATTSASLIFDNNLVIAGASASTGVSITDLYIGGGGFLRVRNNIFHANNLTHSSTTGVSVRTSGAAVAFVNNNTIYDNTVASSRPGLITNGVMTLSNNAIGDNNSSTAIPQSTYQFFAQDASPLTLRNNHFQTMAFAGGTLPAIQTGTTTGVPQWTQFGSRMVPDAVSQLRNSGLNNPSGGLPSIDFSGSARVVDGTVDRGAVEAPSIPVALPDAIFASGFED